MSKSRRLPWGQRLQAAASILTDGAVAAGRYGPHVPASEWNSRFTAPDHPHVTAESSLQVSAVYACTSLLSDTVAQLPAGVYQREGARRIRRSDHPVDRLLSGNVNVQIERDASGSPVGLWSLNAAPRRNASGRLIYQAGNDQLSPTDVIHVRGLSQDGLNGQSPIAAARNAIALSMHAERFGTSYFANDSKSGGVIIQPAQTNVRAKRQAQDNVASSDFDGQGGPSRAHMPKILDPGVKFLPTTIPPNEAQFLETRGFQVEEIARMYRVPLVLIQSVEKTTSWGSGVEQLMIGFAQWTIAPLAMDWEQELTAKLLTDEERASGLYIRLDMRGLLRGDMAARSAFYANAIQWGWMTPNEARAREELDPLPGGDRALRPLNMAPSNDNE